MFEKRKNTGIIFGGNHIPGQPIRDTVKNGDSVVLRHNGESILVRNIKSLGASRFKGTIYGFEPSVALEHKGLKLEDEVEFEEQNIISCSEA